MFYFICYFNKIYAYLALRIRKLKWQWARYIALRTDWEWSENLQFKWQPQTRRFSGGRPPSRAYKDSVTLVEPAFMHISHFLEFLVPAHAVFFPSPFKRMLYWAIHFLSEKIFRCKSKNWTHQCKTLLKPSTIFKNRWRSHRYLIFDNLHGVVGA